MKKLLALSFLFGSAVALFSLAPAPPSRGQNKAQRQTVALEKEGLTAQRYDVLYQIVSADLGLREKALKLIEEERGKS